MDKSGYKPTAEDMCSCRQDILDMKDDPEFATITNSIAFYNLSEFRDLVFHAREHLLTLPEIGEMLAGLDPELIGFKHGDATAINRYRRHFPQESEMRSVEYRHQFEQKNQDTFENCYNFLYTNRTSAFCAEQRPEWR